MNGTKNEINKLDDIISEQNKIISEQLYLINLLRDKICGKEYIKNGIICEVNEDLECLFEECKKNRDYECLVFSGGSIKGISFCGALSILEKEGVLKNIKKYAGTSAGSIVASLLAVGYTPDELKKALMKLDIDNILDDKLGIIRDAINFIIDYGACPGDFVYNFLGEMIEKKTGDKDYTMQQLYNDNEITLVIVGTDMNKEKSAYFYPNSENKYESNISIRMAIRISMSIPFIFEPVEYNGDKHVDGGILDNYPIHVFDGLYPGEKRAKQNLRRPNPKVLGLRIVTDKDISKNRNDIKNGYQYGTSFINTLLAENERRIMTPSNWKRTITIITPYYPLTDFKLDDNDKKILIKTGEDCCKEFF